MRLLAFTDFHASVKALKRIHAKVKKFKPDLAVCCGDVSIFEQHITAIMERLDSLGMPLLLIHGNHEEEGVLARLAKKYKNIFFLHKKLLCMNSVLFVGYGGQGFVKRSQDFERFITSIDHRLKGAEKVVLLTHQPPFGTKLDRIYNLYAGNESFTKCIKKYKSIVLALSGHIHENFLKKDKLNNALLLNPGPEGVIIELS